MFLNMSKNYKNISVISTGSWVPNEVDQFKEQKGTYQVQINELVLDASIGIHEHERKKKQRVSISMSIHANDNLSEANESISNVVSYEDIIKKLKKLIGAGHIDLIETLSEKIFDLCFDDSRVLSVWMKLEKLDVFSEAKSVGIEIARDQTSYQKKKKSRSNITKIKK